jgi:hypothetical protein
MDYSILSLQALPFLRPIIISVILLNVALYAHLHFKHVSIKPIATIAALLMIPCVAFYVPLLSRMTFDFNFLLINVHFVFCGFAFIGILIFSILSGKKLPSATQILGVVLFLFGFYSFLA